MAKKFVVRLSENERQNLRSTVDKLKGKSQKLRRANILLLADCNGPSWTDEQIAIAHGCTVRTVDNVRRRLVTLGLDKTLSGVARENPPTPKLLDGRQEAEMIALKLTVPPMGYSNWSLRLLARKVVELGLAESISHETVRKTLKKLEFPRRKSWSIG